MVRVASAESDGEAIERAARVFGLDDGERGVLAAVVAAEPVDRSSPRVRYALRAGGTLRDLALVELAVEDRRVSLAAEIRPARTSTGRRARRARTA